MRERQGQGPDHAACPAMIAPPDSSEDDGLRELDDIAVLCAERVNQMTRTCNDIETVTSLLEEKERDLELAARIGQTLLSKNQDLSSRKEALEEQLSLANDTINQLKHELSKKVQELEVYDQDLQNQNQQDDSNGVGAADPSPGNAAVEKLQRKVGTLEEENLNLRLETAQLRSDTESYEVKEKKLVKESLQQFVELTQKVDTLTEELKGKKKENSQQREEISSLIAQLNDICQRVRQLTEENADLLDKLQAAQESQTQLARELSIQKDRYDELFETLERTQEQLRYQSQGSQVRAGHQSWPSSPDAISMDSLSLASELQQSLNQKLSQDEDRPDNRSFNWRVFETARAAHRAASKSRSNSMRLSSSASSCWDADSLPASVLNSDTESMTSDGYGGDMDSVCGSTREMGRPGVPGSNDLQTALQRLAGKQGYDSDDAHRARGEVSTFRTPGTPDSLSSGASGYSYLGCSRNPQHSSSQYKMSSKLQIVKPMEGSVTLQQWQRLAQPHLGGLFERREGVKVKGERKLDLDGEAYTLSDFEDEDGQEYQSSLTESSGCLPLLSSANHHNVPSLHSLASLPSPSQRASTVSPQPMASSTPSSRRPSRQSGDSRKYTMSLGLAAVLQDRDTSLARAIIKTNATCPKVAAGPLNNSSSVPVIPAEAVATASAGSLVNPMSRASQGQHPSSDSHHGLFGKLISSGYNLLWNKSDAPVPPATESAHSQETVPEEGAQAAAQNPAASQMFPKGGSGVLGAIATLRKNGIL
ncbi:trafficking kinesin-binding protein 1-like isoform X2 [Babylonia areolata]|uniref:trafficking kinesin-binding protein 1-like isoform X2 n=1 Tax=Babylonia areolata TaxID=304850 RepID=UPI003FD55F80